MIAHIGAEVRAAITFLRITLRQLTLPFTSPPTIAGRGVSHGILNSRASYNRNANFDKSYHARYERLVTPTGLEPVFSP